MRFAGWTVPRLFRRAVLHPLHPCEGACQILNFPLLRFAAEARNFQRIEHFLHRIERAFEGVNDALDVPHGLLD